MLIGTETGNVMSYQLDYDIKKDFIIEKSSNLINLKQKISGIGVKSHLMYR